VGKGQEAFEIERRYLVRVDQGLWDRLGESYAFRQGYVRTGSPSVRVRIGEPRGPVLTLKSGNGVRRREVETVVPQEVAEGLLEASGTRVVDKVRYPIGRWELDRFQGGLVGLTLLEIELEHETEAVPAPPDGVYVMREVTDDKNFTSNALSRMTVKEQKRLVKQVYGKDEKGRAG
jgi:CYTH domain-containing protein